MWNTFETITINFMNKNVFMNKIKHLNDRISFGRSVPRARANFWRTPCAPRPRQSRCRPFTPSPMTSCPRSPSTMEKRFWMRELLTINRFRECLRDVIVCCRSTNENVQWRQTLASIFYSFLFIPDTVIHSEAQGSLLRLIYYDLL